MRLRAHQETIAYFSMEIALEANIPTYSGGLGILAGDTLRSAADLGVSLVAVTLLHRQGYFRQRLDGAGNQREEPQQWSPAEWLEEIPVRAHVEMEGRQVAVRAWRYVVMGVTGESVPVYLLDTDLEENSEYDRTLTDHLYGGDDFYRLCQETVLGLGGLEMLRKLEIEVTGFHMNEGHSALLALGLLERRLAHRFAGHVHKNDIEGVRHRCIFTTHTPVPAGHDQFPTALAEQILGRERLELLQEAEALHDDALNMTYLALRFSGYVNGVAMRHGEVSRGMFPKYTINAITNGVHAVTWTAPPFRELFDRYLPAWRTDNHYLRYAIGIPLEHIREAHQQAKRDLFQEIGERTGARLDPELFTIGFARRASTYKRADLLFRYPEKLLRIAHKVGPLQLVYGGKAHPRDEGGKALIRNVFAGADAVRDAVRTVYVENYDMRWGLLITSGVDLWLNNPLRPQEASGTSGMKAALNGVPSFSVLDGWWVEGHIEGVTGWEIGDPAGSTDADAELVTLYDKLEREIVPMYYGRAERYAEVMRSAIALNGSFFNTQRMVSQYLDNAYAMRSFPTTREEAPAK